MNKTKNPQKLMSIFDITTSKYEIEILSYN